MGVYTELSYSSGSHPVLSTFHSCGVIQWNNHKQWEVGWMGLRDFLINKQLSQNIAEHSLDLGTPFKNQSSIVQVLTSWGLEVGEKTPFPVSKIPFTLLKINVELYGKNEK